jgi:hypothetical protein
MRAPFVSSRDRQFVAENAKNTFNVKILLTFNYKLLKLASGESDLPEKFQC